MKHSTSAVSTTVVSAVCTTARALPPEVELMEVRLDGMTPPGCEAVLVEIIDRRAAGIRVRQGARTTEWLPTSQIMIEVGPLAAMHTLTRLYVPRWLIERTGLHTLTRDQVERDRAGLEAHRARWEERRALVEVLYERHSEREYDEPHQGFDEALAACQFESSEQIAQRDFDGRRYDIIALDPKEEDNAAGRAQIYAYALIEHIEELMHDTSLGHQRYVMVVRECKAWMATLADDHTMEPQTKEALMLVLTRARHAANAARRQQPHSVEAAAARRDQELRAMRALERVSPRAR